MWMDVIDLRDFYQTPLGLVARRLIRRRLRTLWPDVKGQQLLGLGYAVPYLGAFRAEAARVIAAMPARQGVMHWPQEGAGLTLLGDETSLPLPDVSMDRVLLVHALECSESLRHLLREVWRVLAPGGRIIVVVPNRRGLWAHMERTPFGHGHPYSLSQLSALLRGAMFTPLNQTGALFLPPTRGRMFLAGALAWERVGERWFRHIGGVSIIEANKQVYAGTRVVVGERRYAALPNAAPPSGGNNKREKE